MMQTWKIWAQFEISWNSSRCMGDYWSVFLRKSENHGPDSCLLKKEDKVLPKTRWSTQWETPQMTSTDRLEQHVACSNALWFLMVIFKESDCCIHLYFVFILLDLLKSCRKVLGSLYKCSQLQIAWLYGAFLWKFTDHFKSRHLWRIIFAMTSSTGIVALFQGIAPPYLRPMRYASRYTAYDTIF